MKYHVPVLAKESVDAMSIKKDGIYVDATFGGGSHSRMILERLGAKGQLFGFDIDEDAARNVPEDDRFTFVNHNFRHIKRFLKLYGVKRVDGILADLGVSSFQLDTAERGFSYRYEAKLDMRMGAKGELTAADVVNTYPAEALQNIFSKYGEIRNAKTLANRIVSERNRQRFVTTGDLVYLLESMVRGGKWKYFSQVFQALRIEVNDEMGALRDFLTDALEVLKEGGSLVVISYHSLEDRMVKNFLKTGDVSGEVRKDFYGNIYRPFKLVFKKPVTADEKEIKENPRARSGKLRVGRKV